MVYFSVEEKLCVLFYVSWKNYIYMAIIRANTVQIAILDNTTVDVPPVVLAISLVLSISVKGK